MPFDGIAVNFIVDSLNWALSEGRVEKALQPERDEIVLVIRARGSNHRLLLSASANCPRIHITQTQKENPAVPPVFCMLLRKHIVGGRINKFSCLNYDRIVEIEFGTTDDFGESCIKYLIIEIMGRHSNIILLNQDRKIIDSVKHVDFDISSVREVMPGRKYDLPPGQDKANPGELVGNPHNIMELFNFSGLDNDEILNIKGMRIDKFIIEKIKGFSPMLAREVCEIAGIDDKLRCNEILFGTDSDNNITLLSEAINTLLMRINNTLGTASGGKSPGCVFFKEPARLKAFDFYFIDISQYEFKKSFNSFNEALDFFYSSKDNTERLLQKKSALIKLISNNIDRCLKKIGIQEASLKEADEGEKYKLYGELITANLYQIKKPVNEITVQNYYSENAENVTIPLDPNKSANYNAQSYFRKYNKAKSTRIYAAKQLAESKEELIYLQSVMHMLEAAENSSEINEIKDELIQEGYMKRTGKKKPLKNTLPTPRTFKLENGIEILVGRNNKQNDILTLKTASNNDYWLHTKNMPGSHVIIRTRGLAVSEEILIKAAKLAAFYSSASGSENVPVDYTLVKHVRKPSGSKPGMVIYDNQKTLYVTPNPDIS